MNCQASMASGLSSLQLSSSEHAIQIRQERLSFSIVFLQLWLKRKELPDLLCAAAELPLAELVALASSAVESSLTAASTGMVATPSRTVSRAIDLPVALSQAFQMPAWQPQPDTAGSEPSAGLVLHLLLQYSATACAGGADTCAGSMDHHASAPAGVPTAADAGGDGQLPEEAAAREPGAHWVVDGADADSAAFIDLGESQDGPVRLGH